jgi:hypothetical protein
MLDRARMEMVKSETGTSKTLGQDDIGHPQLVPIILAQFWPVGEDY